MLVNVKYSNFYHSTQFLVKFYHSTQFFGKILPNHLICVTKILPTIENFTKNPYEFVKIQHHYTKIKFCIYHLIHVFRYNLHSDKINLQTLKARAFVQERDIYIY